ncbi:MAG: 4-(cytidine 5'-diphospho)-2-C-methyl-D-erythritol kinase [Ginsengibacter sp.]
MVIFPNCKINLGLNVIRKRPDGYHDIETIFYPIPITDVLEIITSDETHIHITGLPIDFFGDNICIRAYDLLKKDYPDLPKINIHLHKVIPIGAGLGGGSSNGISTLLLLNSKYNLQIPVERLYDYALELGSDCPFFILNKPAFASGRGENLEEIQLSLSGYQMLIVNPGIHINTKDLFQQIKPKEVSRSIKEIIQLPIDEWKDNLDNDFEKVVFEKHAAIKNIKDQMYAKGAIYALMTGTGSSVFGIFPGDQKIEYYIDDNYFHRLINL